MMVMVGVWWNTGRQFSQGTRYLQSADRLNVHGKREAGSEGRNGRKGGTGLVTMGKSLFSSARTHA